jgi:hypothetical protein
MGDATLIRDRNFAVDDHVVLDGAEHVGEGRRECLGAVEPVAAEEPQPAAAVEVRDQSVPVMLDFMQPAVALGRLGAGRYQCQIDSLESSLHRTEYGCRRWRPRATCEGCAARCAGREVR